MPRFPMGFQYIECASDLEETLASICFKPSCVDFDWTFEWVKLFDPVQRHKVLGWLVNTRFRRPDTSTGVVGSGRGRQEFIPFGASREAVIKTCWLLVSLIVEHELREAFCVMTDEGPRRVFDPHATIEALASIGSHDAARTRNAQVVHRDV